MEEHEIVHKWMEPEMQERNTELLKEALSLCEALPKKQVNVNVNVSGVEAKTSVTPTGAIEDILKIFNFFIVKLDLGNNNTIEIQVK